MNYPNINILTTSYLHSISVSNTSATKHITYLSIVGIEAFLLVCHTLTLTKNFLFLCGMNFVILNIYTYVVVVVLEKKLFTV